MGDLPHHSPPYSLETGTLLNLELAILRLSWLSTFSGWPSCFCPPPIAEGGKLCWTPVGAGDPSLGLYAWVSSALTHWTISSALLFGIQLYSLKLLSCINPPSSHFWIKINWKGVYEQSFKSMSFPYMGQGIPYFCLHVLACDLCTDSSIKLPRGQCGKL